MLAITAHAKINLALDVLGTLPGGYHEVKMVMQSLELHDTLEINSGTGENDSAEIRISSDSELIPTGSDNLVYKAARYLQEVTGVKKPVHLHIKKKIPVAAGLAGGSADAAAALMGLNMFWETGVEWEKLLDIGAGLGADVPYCMTGKTALATGKGEKLQSLPLPPEMGVVLVKPGFGVSTGEVYRRWDGLARVPGPYSDAMVEALQKGSTVEIARRLGNALEPVAAGMYPEIRQIKEELTGAGVLGAEMSGSGPTVFGLTDGMEEAGVLAGKFAGKYEQALATCTGAFYPRLQ